MIKGIDPEVFEIVLKGTRDQRSFICSESFPYFAMYYFSEYFTYEAAPFHWDMFGDAEDIINGDLREVLWIAFRESAKTSIAKMFVTWCICYKKRKYIAWDSYDGTNAESALFDIVLNLQTNKKILKDFGSLYKKKKHQKTKEEQEEDAPEMKRGSVFITTNKIKVECFTTQYSPRGRLSGKDRPDLFIFDDIENEITKESIALTSKIIRHVDAVNSGLQNYGAILYLGNYISEEGVVAHIKNRLENKKRCVVRNIKIIEGGKPSWPGKYTMTNEEALLKNVQVPKEEHVVSIEQKRLELTPKVFNTEMMNDPGKSGDYYFDREKVRLALKLVTDENGEYRQPIKEIGEFKIWDKYMPNQRYGGGADTAAGNGGDSNASVFFNFSTIPNRVVGTFKSNELSPTAFGSGLAKQARYFGECFIVPEINNTGYATVAKLLEEEYWNMYVREVKNKTTQKMQKEYGFYTNESNKYEVASEFKDAFESGQIEVLDADLLNEMYHFTKQDLKGLSRASTAVINADGQAMTRHFDLLKGAFLGWEARRFSTLSKEDKSALYKAPKRDAYMP